MDEWSGSSRAARKKLKGRRLRGVVKDEDGDVLADVRAIAGLWRKFLAEFGNSGEYTHVAGGVRGMLDEVPEVRDVRRAIAQTLKAKGAEKGVGAEPKTVLARAVEKQRCV